MDMLSPCRTCLSNNGIYNIFSTFKSQKSTQVACFDMMSSVLSFPAREGDKLPVSICQKCFIKLTSAYKFKTIAEQSFRKLQSRFYSQVFNENNHHNESDRMCQNNIKLGYTINNIKEAGACLERLKADVSASTELESKPNTGTIAGGGRDPPDDDVARLSDGFFSDADDVPLKFSNYSKEKCAPPKSQNRKASTKKDKMEAGEPTVCAQCGELVRDLRLHLRSHRGTHGSRRLPCSECPKVFACYSGRKKHVATHHLGQLFFCDICKKYYKRGREHLRLMHSSAPRPFACALCPKAFLTRTLLRLHLSCHAQERSFSCPLCPKLFRNKSNRDIHRRSVHEKERNFICQYCSRGFFSSQELKKHLWCHTNEKNYKCKECGKTFARSSNMRLHEKKHSGIKDVQCNVCSKGFYNKGALKNHMISHSQEKNHECKYCGLRFGRAYSRNKHHKTAHENKL